jgi:hypothetical protein
VSFAAALVFFLLSLWLLVGGLSRPARDTRAARVRGRLTAVAAGVLCGLWWFAEGYPDNTGCYWSGSTNGICAVGNGLSGIGGAAIPLGWLLFAVGAFTVLATVGLAGALLRMLFADRLRQARPVLARIGIGLFVVAAVLLADLSLADHSAASTDNTLQDPLAQLTDWFGTPARTAYPNGIAWFTVLFVVLVIVAGPVQAARRRRVSSTMDASPVSPS